MKTYSVKEVLNNFTVALDETIIELKGWVRSRRDSKAGLSFIALTDGSCFDTIQIVAENKLANYDSEILHLT
ncbi:MAG TPA: OB-fold nucleic acid binding domain-containing protein, partial [Burkholderiales bacterium]|nr:OB-fold nucleic acid binding domain-containing protein [Burkholderiales bacterium]